MSTLVGLTRALVMGGAMLLLAGCPANLQGAPRLVGEQGDKTLYSIDGFTDFGQLDEKDAAEYATKYAQAFCKTSPTVIRVTTNPSQNLVGLKALWWTAIYTCDQPRK